MDQGYRVATRTQLDTRKKLHSIIYLKAAISIVLQS